MSAKRKRAAEDAAAKRDTSIVAGLTLGVFMLSVALTVPPPLTRPEALEPRLDPVTWAAPQKSDTLRPGGAVSEILASRGYDAEQIRLVTKQIAKYRSPRTLRPGVSFRFSDRAAGGPDRIRLQLHPDSTIHIMHADSGWTTHVELTPFKMDTVIVSGVIETSLWSARLDGDTDRFGTKEFEELVYALADVFAWKVDFTRDLRRGDTFRIALERKVRSDGSVRSRHFLAIEFTTRGETFRAFPQALPGERYAYFDEQGRSLRGAFLRYPVPYRITSRFTSRRYHPVLKRYRAHEGIDYGAPAGAPVEATASGVVARAGWAGGYGRIVELRHPQGIRTRYAHLRSIAPDVRPGVHVAQGQIIGRVGSSGLASGPHLHYEFLQNGRHRNPLTVEIPSAPSIAPTRLAEFRSTRDHALVLLSRASILEERPTLQAAEAVAVSPAPRERFSLARLPRVTQR
ncbi:MAG TPA: M23 family metallopeptidase [Candidatus Eisenbacteria bacterium]|nr:M23 family metallopeptidase [Candidatus Eisenbacteria bacterium]